MIKQTIKIALVAFTAILNCACAKNEPTPTQNLSLITFQKWMATNHPEATVLTGNEKGDIYLTYLKHGPQSNDSLKIKENMWFYYKYTGYNMSDVTFITRDSVTSRVAGKWTNTTHWVDDFEQYKAENGNFILCQGITEILPQLKTGDVVRAYLAADKAFSAAGVSINTGYLGETKDYANRPCYFDIEIGKILSNPAYEEDKNNENFARENWRLQKKDTVINNVYMNYVKKLENGEPIGPDSTVQVFFKQTFLDGFLITTNNDSIAKKYNRYNISDTYGYNQFKPSDEYNEAIAKVFYQLVKKMRRGETAEFLVTSRNTPAGIVGNFSSTPQIPSYSPAIYTIHVLTKDEKQFYDKKK